MTTQNQKPIDTIRDGKIKATIWKNTGEKGSFYSVDISRTYKQGDDFKDSHSYSGTDLLQVSRLAQKACDRIADLRQQDTQDAADNGAHHEPPYLPAEARAGAGVRALPRPMGECLVGQTALRTEQP